MLKWLYYICLAFAGFVILLIVISIIPIPGNFKALTVLSGSMEPAIRTGSVVFVKPAGKYKEGDIITFGDSEGNKALTTHRIVEIENEGGKILYTVKGDANNTADRKKVLNKDVVGKTLFSIPLLGYLLNFARQPIGFILLIWIPAAVVIWEEIEKIRKELKKKPKAGMVQEVKEISKAGSRIEPEKIILKKSELKDKIETIKIEVIKNKKAIKKTEASGKKKIAKSDIEKPEKKENKSKEKKEKKTKYKKT